MNDQPTTSASSVPAVLLAARFLFPFDDHQHMHDPNWRNAGRWLVFWGLLIGVLYAVLFQVGWRWFGEYQKLRLVPVVVVLVADLAWCGYRLVQATVRVVASRDQQTSGGQSALTLPALIAVLLIVIAKLAILLALPMGARMWPAGWREHLGVLFPGVIYRPLILMPLWGRWAMALAMSIGRVAPGGSNRLQQMAGGTKLPTVMLQWLACTALTLLYCSAAAEHLAQGLAISLAVLVAAYLVTFVFARRAGGQTEATVGVTALAGELAFLILYLPFASRIYWY